MTDDKDSQSHGARNSLRIAVERTGIDDVAQKLICNLL